MTPREKMVEKMAMVLWTPWERASEGEREDARITATAALDAILPELMDVSEGMLVAGHKAFGETPAPMPLGSGLDHESLLAVYTAMIKEKLG